MRYGEYFSAPRQRSSKRPVSKNGKGVSQHSGSYPTPRRLAVAANKADWLKAFLWKTVAYVDIYILGYLRSVWTRCQNSCNKSTSWRSWGSCNCSFVFYDAYRNSASMVLRLVSETRLYEALTWCKYFRLLTKLPPVLPLLWRVDFVVAKSSSVIEWWNRRFPWIILRLLWIQGGKYPRYDMWASLYVYIYVIVIVDRLFVWSQFGFYFKLYVTH